MIKDVMERDMINEISTLFVMIFTSGLMFVMPILDIGYNDILVIIGFGILLSFMLTIIPILLSYDIRDEIIELIGDMDSQIVVDTSVYKTNLPQVIPRADINQFDFKYDSILSAASLGVCPSHSHAVSSSGILNNSQCRFS